MAGPGCGVGLNQLNTTWDGTSTRKAPAKTKPKPPAADTIAPENRRETDLFTATRDAETTPATTGKIKAFASPTRPLDPPSWKKGSSSAHANKALIAPAVEYREVLEGSGRHFFGVRC